MTRSPGELLVVDTNVVVSGLLTATVDSPTRLLLDRMLAGTCRFLLSVALLSEYREVLLRPRIAALHGLDEPEIDELLVRLTANARIVAAPESAPPAIAADGHLIAMLDAAPGAILVTGDLPLARRLGRRARSPRAATLEA